MAKAWVTDLWVKDYEVEMPDGTASKLSPTAEQMKAITKLPDHFKTARFGRGKRWRVTWHEDVDGEIKARTRSFERLTGPQGAEAYKTSMDEDIRVGRYVDPSQADQRFRDVAKKWMDTKRRIEDTSWIEYQRKLDRYVIPKWGSYKIGQIDRSEIDQWVTQLSNGTAPFAFTHAKNPDGTEKTPKPFGHSYLTSVVRTVFGGVIRYAIGERWIQDDPLARVELPKPKTTKRRSTLTHQQVEDFAKACEEISGEYRDYVAIHLMGYSAPRINEAFALQKHHLDLSLGRAEVEQTWKPAKAGGRQVGLPKNGETRTVPLVDHVLPMLKTLMTEQPEDGWVFRQNRVDSALWSHNWYNRVWVPAATKMGFYKRFTKFSPHTLRHTGITFAIAAGADIKVVQALAGHKDANMTLNLYGHLFPDKLEQVRVLMAAHRAAALKPKLAPVLALA